MAEYQSVSINEPTESENITLEEQAKMQEEQASSESTDRPEWLDEKFESPEELAKAYNELQKKQGSGNGEDTEEEVVEEEEEEENTSYTSQTIQSATEEFAESGTLSDKTFNALEDAGIPRDFVQAYIEGQKAVSEAQAQDVKNVIGGSANYEALAEWAGENLSESDLDAYNSIVEGGSLEQAKVAVKGLYSQFISAGGKPPVLSQGSTSGSSVKPFGSTAQITQAMSDPRYATDPAYRKTIEERIAVSNVI